jgi:hypothetical protein
MSSELKNLYRTIFSQNAEGNQGTQLFDGDIKEYSILGWLDGRYLVRMAFARNQITRLILTLPLKRVSK